MTELVLVSRDGWFCKDGRGWRTSSLGRAHGLAWPFPSTVRGALRTAWGRSLEARISCCDCASGIRERMPWLIACEPISTPPRASARTPSQSSIEREAAASVPAAASSRRITSSPSCGSACQISSLTNGMNGCSMRRMPSSTFHATQRAARRSAIWSGVSAAVSSWPQRGFAISRYQSQYSFQTKS